MYLSSSSRVKALSSVVLATADRTGLALTHKSRRKTIAATLAAVGSVAILPAALSAATGTWNVNAGGNWSVGTNWAGGTIADGADETANFVFEITATRAVSLDSDRTIGNLTFQDTPTSSNTWTLQSTGSPAKVLTLDVSTGAPVINVVNQSATVSLTLAGNDGLQKTGTGVLALSGTNTYTGGTTISAGTVRANSNASLSTGAVSVASGSTLAVGNGITLANNITLNGGVISVDTAVGTLNGSLTIGTTGSSIALAGSSPTPSLTLNGALIGSSTFTLGGITGLVALNNDNSTTFSGQLNVSRTTLALGHNGAAGSGTLNLGVNDQPSGIRSSSVATRNVANVVALTGNGSSIYNFGSSTASVNGDLNFNNTANIAISTVRKFQVNNRTTFAGGFTGSGGGITTQVGTGTLVLNGTNTYTGATTVNTGSLLINGTKTGTGTVTVATAGLLGGNGSIAGATTVNGTLAPGDTVGVLSFTGAVTLASTATSNFDVLNTGSTRGTHYDGVNVAGVLTYGGTLNINVAALTGPLDTFDLFSFTTGTDLGDFSAVNITGGYTLALTNTSGVWTGTSDVTTFTFTEVTGDLTVVSAVVPEPASFATIALAGLMGLRRRRR